MLRKLQLGSEYLSATNRPASSRNCATAQSRVLVMMSPNTALKFAWPLADELASANHVLRSLSPFRSAEYRSSCQIAPRMASPSACAKGEIVDGAARYCARRAKFWATYALNAS